MRFSLSWTLVGRGWAKCEVGDGQQEFAHLVSYIGGPEELLTAVARLVTGAEQIVAHLPDEPALYRWDFLRHDRTVAVTVSELTGGTRTSPSVERWSGTVTVDQLARTVLRCFDRVLHEHGQDGYEESWCRPFPAFEVEALRSAWDH